MDAVEDLLFDEASLDAKLTLKQECFVQEYLVDFIGSKAALRAGYSPSASTELLRLPGISSRIRQGVEQKLSRIDVKSDQIIVETSLLALSRIDWFHINDTGSLELTEKAPAGAMGCVASFKKKIRVVHGKGDAQGYTEYDCELRLWDKPAPLKLLGRHVGLFPDKVEHTGKDGKPIETVTRIEHVIVDPKETEHEA